MPCITKECTIHYIQHFDDEEDAVDLSWPVSRSMILVRFLFNVRTTGAG